MAWWGRRGFSSGLRWTAVTTAGVAIKGAKNEKTVHQLSKTESGREKLKAIEAAKEAAKF